MAFIFIQQARNNRLNKWVYERFIGLRGRNRAFGSILESDVPADEKKILYVASISV